MKKIIFLAFFLFLAISLLLPVSKNEFRINFKKGESAVESIQNIDEKIKLSVLSKLFLRVFFFKKKIFPGSYLIKKNISTIELIRILKNGYQTPIWITLREGMEFEELKNLLVSKLDFSKSELEEKLEDRNFLESVNLSKETVFSIFLPDSYQLYYNISPRNLVLKMHKNFELFWNNCRKERASSLKLSPIEVCILASIVQMETNFLDEASTIASVYLNRLKKKMPLGADPTIKFILKGKNIKRILKEDIKIISPYNTYKNLGLPIGPICIPSKGYIDAVLDSIKSDYFFFCAKDDFSGRHVFCNSFKEHINFSIKYKKRLSDLKIFR